jgi:hypothetical protein
MKTELEILRELAQYYAENGYSKAIKALKEIESNKKSYKTPILKQYSTKDGSYYSKSSEVLEVLKKIFKKTERSK